eukprot:5624839-Pyramimonas_sp.AAC.1
MQALGSPGQLAPVRRAYCSAVNALLRKAVREHIADVQQSFKASATSARVAAPGSTSSVRTCTVDVKGNRVDAKGCMVDVKGNNVDATGYTVDVKGYSVAGGGAHKGLQGEANVGVPRNPKTLGKRNSRQKSISSASTGTKPARKLPRAVRIQTLRTLRTLSTFKKELETRGPNLTPNI